MFGLSHPLVPCLACWGLTLSPADQWKALLDRHIGVALQKEATKRRHWQDTLGAPSTQFYVQDGRLHVGPAASYAVQLLGVEGMDAFLWAWALTDDMRESDPALNLDSQLICEVLKEHPASKLDDEDTADDTSSSFYPEFSTAEPIPLSTTHQGQTFADIAASVLGDECRAVYQVPDYATGLVYYWMVTDDDFPLDDEDGDASACARLSAIIEAMIHPHASHRITSVTAAVRNYAEQALGMRLMVNEDQTQITATPADVFWGDSLLVYVDPTADKIVGLSGQYEGALHTAFVEYDEFGKFDTWDRQPALDLATGLPVDSIDDEDNEMAATDAGKPAINGSTQ